MVYLILFLVGISLAFLDNLASNLLAILHCSAVSITVILLYNIAALIWLERSLPQRSYHHQEKLPSHTAMALESLELYGVVVVDFAIGLSRLAPLQHATEASECTLVLLFFLVGIQLRDDGVTLKRIALNRRETIVAMVVIASSSIGGLTDTFIPDLPISTALTMTSGFDWYSPSDILLTESFGPMIGNAASLNDLTRELIAIMLISELVRCSRPTALGLCGATSMDFILPVLQRTGGLDTIPAAVVHSFILSLLVPILIVSFSV